MGIMGRRAATLALTVIGGWAAAVGAAQAVPLYPDLQTLPPRDLRIDRVDVSADGSGVMRNALRFSNTVYNVGQGPLMLRAQIGSDGSGPATQRVRDSSGSVASFSAGTMYYHDVHSHYHYEGWGQYELWTRAEYDSWVADGRPAGRARRVGTKTTSCVLDEEFIATLPDTPWPSVYGSDGCRLSSTRTLNEGLSVGWGDTYDWYRYEQWIDLGQTVLADGAYVLRSVTDPRNVIHESASKADGAREGALDNEGVTFFTVRGGNPVDSNDPSGTVAVNRVDAVTSTPGVTVTVIGRDDVSGVDQVRISNDGATWKTMAYTATGSKGQNFAWSLTEGYGGTSAAGTKTVHVQTRDRAGKWSATFRDTIVLDSGTSAYVSSVLSDAPAGYWRLGETGGTTAIDRTTAARHGTYTNGPTLGAPGLIPRDPGTAVRFDGSNDHVRISSATALAPSTRLSVEAWIRPDALPAAGTFDAILGKRGSYALQLNGGRPEFAVTVGGIRRRATAPAAAVIGRAYHLVGTYDGAALRLFIDGVPAASLALTGSVATNTNPVTVASSSGSAEFLRGVVDDAAIYGTALAASRISAHYAAGAGDQAPVQHTLSVATAGSGSGQVSSQPAGVLCAPTCSAAFDAGTMVVLTAEPSSTSTFIGWSGACTGRASCQVTMSAAASVTATFDTSTYAAAVAADRPVGHWRLGDVSGTRAADAAADPHHGTYANGVVLRSPGLIPSDPADTAATLDGVDDYVRVPDHPGKDAAGVVTLEAWIKPAAVPAAGSFRSLFSKASAYSLQFNGPQLEFTIIQSGTRRRLQAPSGAVQVGTAYHVVGTYDGQYQRLYLNGAEVASRAQTGPISTNNNPVYVGSWDGTKELFNGTIDEVAIYAVALTATRVRAHHDTAVTTP